MSTKAIEKAIEKATAKIAPKILDKVTSQVTKAPTLTIETVELFSIEEEEGVEIVSNPILDERFKLDVQTTELKYNLEKLPKGEKYNTDVASGFASLVKPLDDGSPKVANIGRTGSNGDPKSGNWAIWLSANWLAKAFPLDGRPNVALRKAVVQVARLVYLPAQSKEVRENPNKYFNDYVSTTKERRIVEGTQNVKVKKLVRSQVEK